MPITGQGDALATLMFNAGRAAAQQQAAGGVTDPTQIALAVEKAKCGALLTFITANALVTVTGVTVGAGVAPGVIT